MDPLSIAGFSHKSSPSLWENAMFTLQDPVSSSTHLFACFCAIFGTLMLRQVAIGPVRRTSVTVFGLSMIFLYAASGLYHAFRTRFLQEVDQSGVYIFIAGSYTPVMAMLLRGKFRQFLLVGIWSLALLGVACIWILPKPPHAATVSFYLGMGWLGLLGGWHYFRATGLRGISWALAGALWYTFGAICELTNWPVLIPGVVQSHEVLHLCIMAASLCHFIFVFKYVVPYVAPASEEEPAVALGYV
jgi:hemolysin III